jgi:hypothetical protein
MIFFLKRISKLIASAMNSFWIYGALIAILAWWGPFLFNMPGTGDVTLFLKSIEVLQDEGVIQGFKNFT